jgi:hypothetical protein
MDSVWLALIVSLFESNPNRCISFVRIRFNMTLTFNVFRCLGCAVMVMGTDSKAATLRYSSLESRSSQKSSTWCLIQSNFP